MTKPRLFYGIILVIFLAVPAVMRAQGSNGYDLLPDYVVGDVYRSGGNGNGEGAFSTKDCFSIVEDGKAAEIYVDAEDWTGVRRAAGDLAADIGRVTGVKAMVSLLDKQASLPGKGSVIVGTIGKSRLIDKLVGEKKLDVKAVKGQWESFVIETVDGSLVVAGSDKRGTIYGVYDISEKIGVSPWHFWADVPVRKSESLHVKNGRYVMPSPKVKYRGIFINDEWPSFGGWCQNRFGGTNSKAYATIFELLLRLKANYLWPAMWANAFNEDDPLNPKVADEYGIVMGTSHHEPMMRSHREYLKRKKDVGPWDYANNKENVDRFFREGMERNKDYENLVTIGMRGDGDTPMGKGDDRENMRVLRDVVKGQRRIIKDIYGREDAVPQLWAIFTEVQRYYDAGFTVPDDVTLLFCDNNWGQIRRCGPLKERRRKGGLGMYYHIDMNGGPASDRWVNTTTAAKLREQLGLAYNTGIDRIWIINVGDLKPKEMPIDFIMRFAWNPNAIGACEVDGYMKEWAKRVCGGEYADEIADIVEKYSKYNLMRKPEVQDPNIFSILNHHESERMERMWNDLAYRAERLYHKIPSDARDAYYQLVYYPVVASAGVARIYLAAGKNNLYARQGRVSANDYKDLAGILYERDILLTEHYNNVMAKGKWNGMMRDNHIGYTSWQIPKENKLPPMEEVTPLDHPAMGVAVEGSEKVDENLALPAFDLLENNTYDIDIFNKGTGCFSYEASASEPWVLLSRTGGIVEKDAKLSVSVDWAKLPLGVSNAEVTINSGKESRSVALCAKKYALPATSERYFGSSGEFSIPAYMFSKNVKGKKAEWQFAPDLGRAEGCMSIFPVTAPTAKPADAPRLEYSIFLPEDGGLTVALGILPVQDINPERGIRMAISVDDNEPVVFDVRKGMHDEFREYTEKNLAQCPHLKPLPKINKSFALPAYGKPRHTDVFDNMRWIDNDLGDVKAGMHTLKVYMIDPEVVLETIVINPDNGHPSYWGKPVNPINAK